MDRVSEPVLCVKCRARIRFVRTLAGRSMPVEATPVETWLVRGLPGAGSVVIIDAATGQTYRGHPVARPGTPDPAVRLVQGYPSHFGNCPGWGGRRRQRDHEEEPA